MPAVSDPGRAVDVDPDVVRTASAALSRVDPDPDQDRLRLPLLGRQSPLDLDGAVHRVDGGLEGDEEAVPLVLHDRAAMGPRCLMDDLIVSLQHGTEHVPEILEHPGRALDVREEETDRPYREGIGCHGWIQINNGMRVAHSD